MYIISLFFFLSTSYIQASQGVVLTYDQSKMTQSNNFKQCLLKKFAAILSGIPVVLHHMIVDYCNQGFIEQDVLKDPSDFFPDGYISLAYVRPTILAAGTNGRDIHIWDTQQKKIIKKLKGHTHSVGAILYNPYIDKLISVSHDATIRIWDPSRDKPIKKIQEMGFALTTLAMLDSTTTIVTGGPDSNMRIWNIITNDWDKIPVHPTTIAKLTRQCFAAISNYGKTLSVFDNNGKLVHDQLSGNFNNVVGIDEERCAIATGRFIEILDYRKWPTQAYGFLSQQTMTMNKPVTQLAMDKNCNDLLSTAG